MLLRDKVWAGGLGTRLGLETLEISVVIVWLHISLNKISYLTNISVG